MAHIRSEIRAEESVPLKKAMIGIAAVLLCLILGFVLYVVSKGGSEKAQGQPSGENTAPAPSSSPDNNAAANAKLGLQVGDNGQLLLNGEPYAGIGVNYFDAFQRNIYDFRDTKSVWEGMKVLEEHEIPFARIMASGFWASEWGLYKNNKEEYFKRLDNVVEAAEAHNIGLIPSLFWYIPGIPDLVGEHVGEWGNVNSATIKFMRNYTREVVTRYKDSPAIWGWEFGNEYNLGVDLPNPEQHRAIISAKLGTLDNRDERDDLTHDIIATAFAEFAKEVRKYDANRIILSGNSAPRSSAWHLKQSRSWTDDTEEQYGQMLAGNNPDPMDTLTVHLYKEEQRFGRPVTFKDVVQVTMDVSKKLKKPLFIGEFAYDIAAYGGTDNYSREQADRVLAEMFAAIEEAVVPISAFWVYDREVEDPQSVSASNDKAYILKMIQDSNRRLQERLAKNGN